MSEIASPIGVELRVEHVSKSFTEGNTVISSISLHAQSGEVIVLRGANGCGKSTLANLIAGLDAPTQGCVTINGKDAADVKLGYVFQDYARTLLPWVNIEQNITLPLLIRKLRRVDRELQLKTLWAKTQFEPLPLTRYPYELSGGQQQRACIIRALLASQEFLILDEPFSSLDQHSKLALEAIIQQLRMDRKSLIILIVHDLDDAIYLADRVVCIGHRPAEVVADIQVPLPWPRNREMRVQQEFLNVRKKILTASED